MPHGGGGGHGHGGHSHSGGNYHHPTHIFETKKKEMPKPKFNPVPDYSLWMRHPGMPDMKELLKKPVRHPASYRAPSGVNPAFHGYLHPCVVPPKLGLVRPALRMPAKTPLGI